MCHDFPSEFDLYKPNSIPKSIPDRRRLKKLEFAYDIGTEEGHFGDCVVEAEKHEVEATAMRTNQRRPRPGKVIRNFWPPTWGMIQAGSTIDPFGT